MKRGREHIVRGIDLRGRANNRSIQKTTEEDPECRPRGKTREDEEQEEK